VKLEVKVIFTAIGGLFLFWFLNNQRPLFEVNLASLSIGGFVAAASSVGFFIHTKNLPLSAIGGWVIYILFINSLIGWGI